MIALNISPAPEARSRFRSASLEMAARVLRDGGYLDASWVVCGMVPGAERGTRPLRSISLLMRDSDTIVRSARRGGLRYAADRLISHGSHDDAALYLHEVADAIPMSSTRG